MNKKSMIFAINVMVFCTTFALPMDDSEKRVIRKELYSNYKNGRINTATLSENGLTIAEVIDRDIQLLFDHKNILQAKISFCKNSVKTDLFLSSFLAGSSIFAGYICKDSFSKIKTIIENDYASGKTGHWFIDKIAYNILPTHDYQKLIKDNVANIAQHDPKMNKLSNITIATAFITVIAGWMFAKKLLYVYDYTSMLHAYLQKLQTHLERDQAIIVQLKEIKQTI